MNDTLALLQAQNSREVWLLLEADVVRVVPPHTPGAGCFRLARVAARDIRINLLYAALGRDGYVAYSMWYQGQAQQAREVAEAAQRKMTDAEPFDDTPEDDADWRAHSLALEEGVEDAVLERGLLDPPYAEARDVLGPYRAVLVREIVQWNRDAPDQDKPFAEKKSSNGSFVPP